MEISTFIPNILRNKRKWFCLESYDYLMLVCRAVGLIMAYVFLLCRLIFIS